jgi:hypothetical protein
MGFGLGGKVGRERGSTRNQYEQTYLPGINVNQLGSQIGNRSSQYMNYFNPTKGPGNFNQFMSGLNIGGIGGGGFDKAEAGKFTKEFDPILEKLTKGPMVEKALAQFLDPISQQAERSRSGILERAGSMGALDSGGSIRAEIMDAGQFEGLKQGARSQAYLGSLGQAVGATNNQVNAITQAESANAGASAQVSSARMQAQAQAMGVRAGLAGQMMQMGDPMHYAGLLNPTSNNLTQQNTSTSSKGASGSAKFK